jgi:hypothetical protein
VRGRTGVGSPDDDLLIGVGGAGQRAPVEGKFADQLVQLLESGRADVDLTCGPLLAELVVAY